MEEEYDEKVRMERLKKDEEERERSREERRLQREQVKKVHPGDFLICLLGNA